MTITFPIHRVNELRKQAREARQARMDGPDGWCISEVDPTNVLKVFGALRLKEGYALRAHQYREDGNGDGLVWAMPVDAPLLDPGNCCSERRRLHPHALRPAEALSNLMDAIQGDGTPWSYLEASLFAREIEDFGVFWQGCSKEADVILGADPFCTGQQASIVGPTPDGDAWRWNEPKPTSWEPSFEQTNETVRIRFYTYRRVGRENIFRTVDAFRLGQYAFQTEGTKVAVGMPGCSEVHFLDETLESAKQRRVGESNSAT